MVMVVTVNVDEPYLYIYEEFYIFTRIFSIV